MTRLFLSLMTVCLFPMLSLAREKNSAPTGSKAAASERAVVHAVVASSKQTSALAGRVASEVKSLAEAGKAALGGRLARLTAYWSGEGDYYTRRHLSSTGVRLHEGHCAVDPSVIPYGSVVQIAGLGNYLAVDTGTAVVSRRAAREAGHTSGERNAIVIDLYFDDRSSGEEFAAHGPKYASISWCKPDGDVVLGRSAVMADESTATPAPAVKPAQQLAAVKPPVAAPKLASVQPAERNAGPVASSKPVGKHDTQNTSIVSSTSNLKGATKLAAFKTSSVPETKTTAANKPQPSAADANEHILIAQEDATSHHKALYQF
jgi:3D (Asp-Asp-Asp) domain-containing protein